MMLALRATFGLLLLIAMSETLARTVIPERYNQGPRLLFNVEADKNKLDEIVAGRIYQNTGMGHGPPYSTLAFK